MNYRSHNNLATSPLRCREFGRAKLHYPFTIAVNISWGRTVLVAVMLSVHGQETSLKVLLFALRCVYILAELFLLFFFQGCLEFVGFLLFAPRNSPFDYIVTCGCLYYHGCGSAPSSRLIHRNWSTSPVERTVCGSLLWYREGVDARIFSVFIHARRPMCLSELTGPAMLVAWRRGCVDAW